MVAEGVALTSGDASTVAISVFGFATNLRQESLPYISVIYPEPGKRRKHKADTK